MMRRFVVGTCAAFAAAAVGGAAAAKPPAAPTRAAVVQAVVDCRKIDDSAQRLACYDAAVAAMNSAETSGDLVTLDRKQRQSVRKQAFGFALPALAMFDTGEKQVDRIDETLAGSSQDAQGRWIFRMEDGAVWRQIDDEFLSRPPHAGSAIVIRQAMLGSYMLSVDGQPGVRAHRDQ
jgi:hypothetical protein